MIALKNKDTLDVLKHEIKHAKDQKYKQRLQAILSVKNGKSRKEIIEALVVSEVSLIEWIKKYNEEGKESLKTKKTGRPKGKTTWKNEIFEKLAQEIDKSDRYWSVRLMCEWIQKEEKESIPESTVWYRVGQIGYSHKSSRPYPYKGDKEKQDSFKKGV